MLAYFDYEYLLNMVILIWSHQFLKLTAIKHWGNFAPAYGFLCFGLKTNEQSIQWKTSRKCSDKCIDMELGVLSVNMTSFPNQCWCIKAFVGLVCSCFLQPAHTWTGPSTTIAHLSSLETWTNSLQRLPTRQVSARSVAMKKSGEEASSRVPLGTNTVFSSSSKEQQSNQLLGNQATEQL